MKRFKKGIPVLLFIMMFFTLSTIGLGANNSFEAKPIDSTVLINGVAVSFPAYSIGSDDFCAYNYYMLRDFAKALSSTSKQCQVQWSSQKKGIVLSSGKPYTTIGVEMASGDGSVQTAVSNKVKICKDSRIFILNTYSINGHDYFKLTDLAKLFNVGMTFKDNVGVDTSSGYVGIQQQVKSKDAKAEKVMVGDVQLPIVDKKLRQEYLSDYAKIQAGKMSGEIGEYGEVKVTKYFDPGYYNKVTIYPNGYMNNFVTKSCDIYEALKSNLLTYNELLGGIKQLYNAGISDSLPESESVDLVYIGDYCIGVNYPEYIPISNAEKLNLVTYDSLSDHAKDWISKNFEVCYDLQALTYKCFDWIPLENAIQYGYITYDGLPEEVKSHMNDGDLIYYNYGTGEMSWTV